MLGVELGSPDLHRKILYTESSSAVLEVRVCKDRVCSICYARERGRRQIPLGELSELAFHFTGVIGMLGREMLRLEKAEVLSNSHTS